MASNPSRTAFLSLAGVIVFAGAVFGADGKLEPGAAAPEFEAINQNGRLWRLADHLGKKHLVVYFCPGDFTEGCSRQAEDFRDRMNLLAEKGISVIGVSGDSVPTHHLFQQLYSLNFTLLSDEAGALAAAFGVPVRPGGKARAKHPDGRPFYAKETRKSLIVERGVTVARWTFVLDPAGKIVDVQRNVDPRKETQRIIEMIDGFNLNSTEESLSP